MRAIVADARGPCENRPPVPRPGDHMTRAVRFQGPGPGIRIGRLEDDAVWDAGAAPAVGFAPTRGGLGARARARPGACFRLDQVTLLAPVVPPKLICIGLNYRLHAEETGAAIPTEPVVFCKLPNAYSGPGDAIVLPEGRAESGLRGRDGARDRHAHPPRRPRRGAGGHRGHHRAQRRLGAQGAAQLRRSVRARQELRHVRTARPLHRRRERARSQQPRACG